MITSLIENLENRKEKNFDLNQLVNNIVLSGGNTLIPNFHTRIQKEVMTQVSLSLSPFVRVVAPENRKNLAWKGASVISQLNSFLKMWVSRVDYEEYGPGIVHRKCSSL
jgi:actin, other eukaryote